MTAQTGYKDQLQLLARQVGHKSASAVHFYIEVHHDATCSFWKDGYCDCCPTLFPLDGPGPEDVPDSLQEMTRWVKGGAGSEWRAVAFVTHLRRKPVDG